MKAVSNLSMTEPQLELRTVGAEAHPVLVIDDFVKDAGVLLTAADNRHAFAKNAEDFYPGVKKPLLDCGYQSAFERLTTWIAEVFAVNTDAKLIVDNSCFAVTTTPEHQLLPIQSIPHYDTPDPNQLAVVHYLCDEGFGGTSFYRHRATGYEAIDTKRAGHYQRVLGRQATTEGLPRPQYINGSTNLFEKTGEVEARFNRAIIYSSCLLHSGNIHPDRITADLSAKVRLTITSNLLVR